MELKEGNIYGIVGNNGCGKTMLMKCICGFVKPTEGKVISEGMVATRRRYSISFPMQRFRPSSTSAPYSFKQSKVIMTGSPFNITSQYNRIRQKCVPLL